ncbi:hypothetical protein BGW80DRAFT_1347419 [Lactifluus volemus]|nr:hypothetical protein BGW80DRAFT_1347419 [Lactifluus volemus]
MNPTTFYQSAILQDDNHPPMSTATQAVKFTTNTGSSRPFTPEFVQAQLTLSNNRSRARAQALYDERVRRRQLVLTNRKLHQHQHQHQRRRKENKKETKIREKMGRREAAEKGLWRLRKEEARWDLFVKLHRLWIGYMSELLALSPRPSSSSPPRRPRESAVEGDVAPMVTGMPQAAGMHAKLVKADFHGSIMTVRRSKNAALVGASGIVVQETENTFKVVTRENKLKVLPKQGSVFTFAVPLYNSEPSVAAAGSSSPVGGANSGSTGGSNSSRSDKAETVLDGPHIEFELYGNQFCFRAADRAGRKFKHKETIEL